MSDETNVQGNSTPENGVNPETTEAANGNETVAEVGGDAVEQANATAEETPAAGQDEYTDVAELKKGSTVKGKIVKVDADQAFVDIGYKYDGIIPIRELSSVQVGTAADVVEVGQEVELKVVSLNDEKEKLVLSKRAVDSENAWDELQQKLDSKETFEAKVTDVVKGGLVVDLGVRGFIPASMVERHFVEDFSDYKGRTLKLRVKEIDREKNKVILSQKDVLDEEFEANKQQVLSGIEAGQVIEGTVQRLTPFGAFVDIGGIDGLVHISEMAWNHVEHPSEVVKEGDKVKVKVLKVVPESERISLSIKAAQPGPWERVNEELEIGSIITGTVKRLASFGAFVEVAPGIEGLVHISQIAHRHIGTPHEVLEEGQQVNVKILDINPQEKRVSLSIKETEEAPAQEAGSERQPRQSRQPRQQRDAAADEYMANNKNEKLSLTLGERFGDKLSKFK
ncbi:30S ribosomal protein S1 [Paenibacillus aurantius]|uniref:30S ribosomal protein S1 n=1 Tax=Paenibacillus aurantius TaxID=2918900 RepID=A0AA96LBL6_9BACL|nr:30S ribosomal protein S1 [Paenibacillus aurantius]WNQ09305.1 30S ribosomal protein S1 [Paenibacillus aurantius]